MPSSRQDKAGSGPDNAEDEVAAEVADAESRLGVSGEDDGGGQEKDEEIMLQGAARDRGGFEMKGALEEMGVNRFSMCFNNGKNGVLRLGSPKADLVHGNIGQAHWGLNFRGISVHNDTAPALFCQEESMEEDQ